MTGDVQPPPPSASNVVASSGFWSRIREHKVIQWGVAYLGAALALEEYILSMKVKTSITLSEDVVKRLDCAARRGENRSQAIERLLKERLHADARKVAESKDRTLIDEHAAELNAEADDVLTYQAGL